jgi:hypothetical protein
MHQTSSSCISLTSGPHPVFLIFRPEGLKGTFWSQILSVHSIIITCGISIIIRSLTRIYTILAATTAGSPLSSSVVSYAIRSMCGNADRLDPTLGCGQTIPRNMVLEALVTWLVLFSILCSQLSNFVQVGCERKAGAQLVILLLLACCALQKCSKYWTWCHLSY